MKRIKLEGESHQRPVVEIIKRKGGVKRKIESTILTTTKLQRMEE